MNYTNLLLLGLGLLGIIMHNLLNLNNLNKQANGNLSLAKYLRLEIYAILLSICVVVSAIIIKQEIKQLEQVGKWLGFAFISIGYMAQSIIVGVMGRAKKVIEFTSKDETKQD